MIKYLELCPICNLDPCYDNNKEGENVLNIPLKMPWNETFSVSFHKDCFAKKTNTEFVERIFKFEKEGKRSFQTNENWIDFAGKDYQISEYQMIDSTFYFRNEVIAELYLNTLFVFRDVSDETTKELIYNFPELSTLCIKRK